MHAATYESSQRLINLVNYLIDLPCGATTAEIQAATGSMAVHSDIAEIRSQADRLLLVVPPAEYAGKSKINGRKIYRYQIYRKEQHPCACAALRFYS